MKHRDEGTKCISRASIAREQVQRHYMDRAVDAVFDGLAEGLPMALFQNRTLSRE